MSADVYIYDATLEATDRSSEIWSTCGCNSSDIATTLAETIEPFSSIAWQTAQKASESLSETINFQFLSSLSITDEDSVLDINTLTTNLSSLNSSSNVSINFECAKNIEPFSSIAWSD